MNTVHRVTGKFEDGEVVSRDFPTNLGMDSNPSVILRAFLIALDTEYAHGPVKNVEMVFDIEIGE